MDSSPTLDQFFFFFFALNSLEHLHVHGTVPTVSFPKPAQGAYQSHFRWALIKTIIVSPELSSGRDLAIQMSVRRPEHFLETVWPTCNLMVFGMWLGLGLKMRMLNQTLPCKGSKSDCSPTALLNLFWAEIFTAPLKLWYHC